MDIVDNRIDSGKAFDRKNFTFCTMPHLQS